MSRTTEEFSETGGAASLSRTSYTFSATFTTPGMQAERRFVVGNEMLLTASASLGWRHAFADTPSATYMLRSEEHTSELQSLMRISYAVFCLKKKKYITDTKNK